MEVVVPDLGDFADVEVIEVLVKPGDSVAAEQGLITLETDKATMDVPAPAGGVVQEVLLKVGDKAPDFELKGSDGKTYSLSQFRGKSPVVIAWFPKAFTQGCTIECKSLAANGTKIREYDVAYFMASVDKLEDNTKFAVNVVVYALTA